jgi:hypothetical protein
MDLSHALKYYEIIPCRIDSKWWITERDINSKNLSNPMFCFLLCLKIDEAIKRDKTGSS